MRYRVFLYKTEAQTAEALEIKTCNRAIGTDDTAEWRHGAAKGLRRFDTAAVAQQPEALAGGGGQWGWDGRMLNIQGP